MFAILVVCVLAGICFAGLATLLTCTKGNRIRDVLAAEHLKDAEAIKIDILNKIKITSNIPIVGLYLVGAIVAFGFPSYFAYINSPGPVSQLVLVGTIDNYSKVVNWNKGERICAHYPEMNIQADGAFQLPLRRSPGLQTVIFESPTINPVTLHLQIIPLEKKAKLMPGAYGRENPIPLDFDGMIINLPPLKISRIPPQQKTDVANRPSDFPQISDKWNVK